MRRLLLAAAAALAITAPAGAETIWRKPTGRWIASLNIMENGPLCVMHTTGRDELSSDIIVTFSGVPGRGISIAFGTQNLASKSLTGPAVLALGNERFPLQMKEIGRDRDSVIGSAFLGDDGATLERIFTAFAGSRFGSLLLPDNSIVALDLTGSLGALANFSECADVVKRLQNSAPVSSKPARRL